MKYFVFSDVHGCIKELKQSLINAHYDSSNPNHYLVFLGDAFDHNKNGHYEMFKFLYENIINGKLKWIMGNHELYLLNNFKDMSVGKFTLDTVRDIAYGFDNSSINYSDNDCLKVLKEHKVDEFIKNNCVHYFETKRYIFTHGFIPYNKIKNEYDPNWRDAEDCRWNSSCSANGMKIVHNGLSVPNKILVCGHIGAYYGYILNTYPNINVDSDEFKKLARKMMKESNTNSEPFKIYYGNGVIGIDGRSYDTHNVNVLVVEDDEI